MREGVDLVPIKSSLYSIVQHSVKDTGNVTACAHSWQFCACALTTSCLHTWPNQLTGKKFARHISQKICECKKLNTVSLTSVRLT